MSIDISRLMKNIGLLVIAGMLVLITQKVGLNMPILDAVPGMLIIILVAVIALIIRDLFPKSIFPAFGWVTILGFLFSMPYNPLSVKFMEYTSKVNFMAITTPLLAFAGLSVGNKIDDLKKMSWKIGLISVIVFITIFFACALIAETVLRLRGDI